MAKVELKPSAVIDQFDGNELLRKTNKMKALFALFISQLLQDIEKDELLDVSVIKSNLVMYDRKLKEPLNCCKSLQEVFETLRSPKYSSFLEYDLIKVLVEYGSAEAKDNWIHYKKQLQKFLEDRLVQQTSGEEVSYAVVIDESLTNEVSDPIQLQNRVKYILGHRDLKLVHLSKALIPQPVPFSEEQDSETSIDNQYKANTAASVSSTESTSFPPIEPDEHEMPSSSTSSPQHGFDGEITLAEDTSTKNLLPGIIKLRRMAFAITTVVNL